MDLAGSMISGFSRRKITCLSRAMGARSLMKSFHQRRMLLPSQMRFARLKTTASVKNETSGSSKQHRPSTPWELFKNFPKGARAMYEDLLRYRNIHAASRTSRNAWTSKSPQHGDNAKEPLLWRIYDNEARPGRIPRRQHEEQRRFIQEDLRTMLPLLAFWAIPGIGYIPMILVVACPRQVLTRQFLNGRDIEDFANIEYGQRRQQYSKLAKFFWGSVTIHVKHALLKVHKHGEDAAGPIFDGKLLYQAFASQNMAEVDAVRLPMGTLAHFNTYPREYVVTLALASGVNQNWPDWISGPVTHLSPSRWNRNEILRKASDIVDDDELLIEEGKDLDGCDSLTDLEVLDACLNRGLPLNVSYTEMRRCLTHHLRMVAEIKSEFPDEVHTEGFKLFTLHLAPLRQHLKTELE